MEDFQTGFDIVISRLKLRKKLSILKLPSPQNEIREWGHCESVNFELKLSWRAWKDWRRRRRLLRGPQRPGDPPPARYPAVCPTVCVCVCLARACVLCV